MTRVTKVSVIIPAFNEEATITRLLDAVAGAPLRENTSKQIVIVDDASTDSTGTLIDAWKELHPEISVEVHRHSVNKGKGAAIHTGITRVTGDVVVIQDADLEYDPQEYEVLLEPIRAGLADVVYGSRFMGGRPHRVLFFWHSIGNRFLTLLSNMGTDLNLTDMETCYKLFRTDLIQSLDLKEQRFGFEPEVTAKISRIPGVRIYEVGISYYGRTYAEGKKIGWRDGFHAMYCILKYNLFSR